MSIYKDDGTMRPMLCKLAPADMIALRYPLAAEIKYDGVRTIAVVVKKKCKLYSRSGKFLENFEEVRLQMQSMPEGVYDGEIISKDGFQALQTRIHAEQGTNTEVPIEYKIFDKLTPEEWRAGESCRTYEERCIKAGIGERVVIKNPVDLELYYNYVLKAGHEGLIVKALNSTYEAGVSSNWLKIKPKDTMDMQIIAIEPGLGKYTDILGAIQCVGEASGYAVNAYIGTGFTDEQRKDIWARKDKLLNTVVEVEYQELTKPDRYNSRSLRFPVFKCLRIDK